MKKNRGEEVANQLRFILSIDVNLANALPTSRGLHPKIKLRKKKKKLCPIPLPSSKALLSNISCNCKDPGLQILASSQIVKSDVFISLNHEH